MLLPNYRTEQTLWSKTLEGGQFSRRALLSEGKFALVLVFKIPLSQLLVQHFLVSNLTLFESGKGLIKCYLNQQVFITLLT